MAPDKQNYIYAYDDKARRIIVINAETGETVDQKDNLVLSLLGHLREQNNDVKLRKFALWCARQTNDHIKPLQKKFFDKAKEVIKGEVEAEYLQKIYDDSEGEAVSVKTVELQKGSRNAPAFLISRECVNPEAFEGAKNAARYYCLWAEMKNEENDLPEFMEEVSAVASQETIKITEQKQIDFLLDLMGDNSKKNL